jgi:transcriptional regulator with XRE-family HTH domain
VPELHSERKLLGAFLRARRDEVTPESVGLPRVGHPRRVLGLRRDEVARLAGISPEYYARLERGQLPSPSLAVLGALIEALRLDPDQERYLREVADRSGRHPRPHAPRPITAEVMSLLDALDEVPAMVMTRQLDIVAWNEPAAALFTDFATVPTAERNAVRLLFLHPEMRARFKHWPSAARNAAALLRMSAARNPDDARLAALVRELSRRDPDFLREWGSQEVVSGSHGPRGYIHPRLGEISLQWQTLSSSADPDHLIIVLTPPG